MRVRWLGLSFIAVALAFILLFTACDGSETGKNSRERSIETREEVFERADKAIPLPRPSNFPLRKALVKFTEREDLENHPWYVYILGQNGNTIGYYVAQHAPVNSCNFLSSTEKLYHDSSGGNVLLTAPSLDGIFYGGGGGAAACDEWFFFDSTTDALIKIRGVHFYVADQPLRLEAAPISVAGR